LALIGLGMQPGSVMQYSDTGRGCRMLGLSDITWLQCTELWEQHSHISSLIWCLVGNWCLAVRAGDGSVSTLGGGKETQFPWQLCQPTTTASDIHHPLGMITSTGIIHHWHSAPYSNKHTHTPAHSSTKSHTSQK
jgi:hypothetical protein